MLENLKFLVNLAIRIVIGFSSFYEKFVILENCRMNFFQHIKSEINKIIEELIETGKVSNDLNLSNVQVEPPRDPNHGDVTSNVGLVLAQSTNESPRDIASIIASPANLAGT